MTSTDNFTKPQLAVQYNEKNIAAIIERAGYVCIDPKVDGVRVIFDIGSDLKATIRSREGKPLASLLWLEELDFSAVFWQPGRFDCEVTVKGMTFQKGCGRIRKAVPLPKEDLIIWPIQYTVEGGDEMPFELRHSMAVSVADNLNAKGFNAMGSGTDMEGFQVDNLEDLRKYYGWARGAGYEGAMVHDPQQPVVKGKVNGWYKMKPEEDIDGTITDTFEGEGQFAGMLGGFVVDVENGTTTRVGTGFTPAERAALWRIRDTLPGRKVQLRFMELTDDGNLRLPVFDRWRDLETSPGVKS